MAIPATRSSRKAVNGYTYSNILNTRTSVEQMLHHLNDEIEPEAAALNKYIVVGCDKTELGRISPDGKPYEPEDIPPEVVHSCDSFDRGHVHMRVGNVTAAIDCYEQCLDRAKHSGDHQGELAAIMALGRLYAKWDAKRAVVAYFEPALALARHAADRPAESAALMALAIMPSALTGIEPMQYANMAHAIADELSEEIERVGAFLTLAVPRKD